MPARMFRYATILAALVLFSVAFAACNGDDDDLDVDESELRPITATATAVVGLPEDFRELTITVEDGEFDTDSIDVVEGEPVILTIANRDFEVYTMMIDELVQETEIAAAAETTIEFNAPNSGEFEGTLADSDGNEVETIFVAVEGAGGF